VSEERSGIYGSIEARSGRLVVVDNYQIVLHGDGKLGGPEGAGGGGLWGSGFKPFVSAARGQTIDRSDPRLTPDFPRSRWNGLLAS